MIAEHVLKVKYFWSKALVETGSKGYITAGMKEENKNNLLGHFIR